MAINATEVSNEQVLQEMKKIFTELQEMKNSLALMASSVAIIKSEVKELPTGLNWASEKRS
jgi:hypothetical protein